MFILTTISDLVSIPPHEFYKRSIDSLSDHINAKYANKVLHRVGLCITLYDILKASDGLIGHGSGDVNVNVEFRMVVFRPFKGEIVTGVVRKCDEDGIRVGVEFFDDLWVPGNLLFPDSV
jgi:DNA-directed RNA polymerase III subunit RPC8